MKKINLNLHLILLCAMFLSTSPYAQIVTIGTQVWNTKNLDVSTFRNGDAIPQVKTDDEWKAAEKNRQPAWCYYDNNPENGVKYGKLYNWYAVNDSRGLAPEGWHVPSHNELNELMEFLNSKDKNRLPTEGQKLKSTSGWHSGNGNNESGLSALPGGYRDCSTDSRYYGKFLQIGKYGYWWLSDTTHPDRSYDKYALQVLRLNHNQWHLDECERAHSSRYGYGYFCSVLCIRDYKTIYYPNGKIKDKYSDFFRKSYYENGKIKLDSIGNGCSYFYENSKLSCSLMNGNYKLFGIEGQLLFEGNYNLSMEDLSAKKINIEKNEIKTFKEINSRVDTLFNVVEKKNHIHRAFEFLIMEQLNVIRGIDSNFVQRKQFLNQVKNLEELEKIIELNEFIDNVELKIPHFKIIESYLFEYNKINASESKKELNKALKNKSNSGEIKKILKLE